MSTLTQFLPQTGIKSVQRGTISIGTSSYSQTATINSVDTSKTFVLWGGAANPGGTSSFANNYYRIELTDSTTVTVNRIDNSGLTVAAYQVVEFY